MQGKGKAIVWMLYWRAASNRQTGNDKGRAWKRGLLDSFRMRLREGSSIREPKNDVG